MRLAIIGLGHVAKYQLEAIAHLRQITLVGAHDIKPEQARILPETATFYHSIETLLNECDADLILVSTPNVTHFEIGRRVLEHGRSLLMEKPCCQTEAEIFDLIAIARRHGKFFAVALHAAYALDLIWYLSQLSARTVDYGPLSGFYLGFYDSYYEHGVLQSSAKSLGGSWFDSGINALSVIGRFTAPSHMQLVEGRMTRVAQLPCSEIQGSATFEFMANGVVGQGIIDTNWTLGLNRKVTKLFYCSTNTQVTLHHSDETVFFHQNGRLIGKNCLQNGLPRLTNHYINLFDDMTRKFNTNLTDIDYALQIHRLLFAAGSG